MKQEEVGRVQITKNVRSQLKDMVFIAFESLEAGD